MRKDGEFIPSGGAVSLTRTNGLSFLLVLVCAVSGLYCSEAT